MNAGKSESWKWFLAAGILLALQMGAVGCGGGGPTTATVPTATIQGSVSGTIIMAIDETGKIAARDDTSGKTPRPGTSPPQYPFTLTVPVGHQYTIQFIVGEGTSEERLVPLYEGTVNIFSVSSEGKLDLGYVDTSGGTAAADNNILLQPGVTSGGTTSDNTISVANPAWGEFLIIALSVIAVLLAEMFNTAIETMVDMVSPELSEKARIAKDISAGAVLVTAFGVAVIGYIILFPYLRDAFDTGISITKHTKEEIALIAFILVLILVIIT